jgi:glycosyl transferase family 25
LDVRKRLTVISLDRTPRRFEQFLTWNPGIEVKRFPAIDGAKLSVMECIRNNLITKENTYIPGALGTALSHIALWRTCASGAEPFHIAEDDIVLRADFWARVGEFLNNLPDWDIALWSHNFDWPVVVAPVVGGALAAIQYDPQDKRIQLKAFRTTATQSALLPLVSAAGISCYSISPSGARRMLADCLPIGSNKARFAPVPGSGWNNTGIDVEMSRHYQNMRAFIAFPPLALAPNDHAESTIRGRRVEETSN